MCACMYECGDVRMCVWMCGCVLHVWVDVCVCVCEGKGREGAVQVSGMARGT